MLHCACCFVVDCLALLKESLVAMLCLEMAVLGEKLQDLK
jgi:hypothetical protein